MTQAKETIKTKLIRNELEKTALEFREPKQDLFVVFREEDADEDGIKYPGVRFVEIRNMDEINVRYVRYEDGEVIDEFNYTDPNRAVSMVESELDRRNSIYKKIYGMGWLDAEDTEDGLVVLDGETISDGIAVKEVEKYGEKIRTLRIGPYHVQKRTNTDGSVEVRVKDAD